MRLYVRVEETVPFPRADVFSWWTDYGESDHASPAHRLFGWSPRRILERDAAGRVRRFAEEARPLGRPFAYESILSYDPPRAVVEESVSAVGGFLSEYAFHRDGDEATRIVWTIEGEIAPPWDALPGRLPFLPRALARLDLRGHVADLTRDLSAARARAAQGEPSELAQA